MAHRNPPLPTISTVHPHCAWQSLETLKLYAHTAMIGYVLQAFAMLSNVHYESMSPAVLSDPHLCQNHPLLPTRCPPLPTNILTILSCTSHALAMHCFY